jgi:hypothetical protein
VVALGPTHLVSANGVSVRARSDWHVVDSTELPSGVEFALQGPSAATFAVERLPVPTSQFVSLDRVAEALNANQVPMPAGATIRTGTAHVVAYPMGQGVQVAVTVKGHDGVAVLVPHSGFLWEVDIATQGSHRAVHEYPDMLRTLLLPGSV